MITIHFEWDEAKNRRNVKKHGVEFSEARTVFLDPFAWVIDDEAHSDAEDRFIILGASHTLRLLVVCHCYRKQDEAIRIISARKATGAERKVYERGGAR